MPEVLVQGMKCEHCRKSVFEAVSKLPGTNAVEVDLAGGKVSWNDADAANPVSQDDVKKTVRAIGFEAP